MKQTTQPKCAKSDAVSDKLYSTTKLDRGNWKQYYACFTVSTLAFSNGLSQGWASPMIQVLLSDDSPTSKMNQSQISFLQTTSIYSAIVSVIFIMITLKRYGVKISGYIQAVINIIGWILLLTATTPYSLYFGRFFTGIISIGANVVCAFFLSEVCSEGIRGTLISISVFSTQLGTLLGYVLGTICGYRLFNALCLPPAVVFPILLFFLPEVASDLVRFKKVEQAIESYIWYREVSYENAKGIVGGMKGVENELRFRDILKVKANQRALIILMFLMAFSVLCGSTVIGSYASEIFRNAHCSLTPNQSASILASTTFIASLMSVILIDTVGRRRLVIGAFVIMAISLYTVIAYFLGIFTMENAQWIIYVSLGGFTSAHAIGITAVTQTMGSEIFASEVKGFLWLVAGLGFLFLNVLSLIVYAQITEHLPYYLNFIHGAVFSTLGIGIGWFIIPETRGKTLDAIIAELSHPDFWKSNKTKTNPV